MGSGGCGQRQLWAVQSHCGCGKVAVGPNVSQSVSRHHGHCCGGCLKQCDVFAVGLNVCQSGQSHPPPLSSRGFPRQSHAPPPAAKPPQSAPGAMSCCTHGEMQRAKRERTHSVWHGNRHTILLRLHPKAETETRSPSFITPAIWSQS